MGKNNGKGKQMKVRFIGLLAILLLVLFVHPVLAYLPEVGAGPTEIAPTYKQYVAPDYKGTWYIIDGEVVEEADLEFLGLPNRVNEFSVGVATNIEFYSQGNYWVARNPTWDGFYFAGANDGSGFYCRYYDVGCHVCYSGGGK
jgi:hypothetical protein